MYAGTGTINTSGEARKANVRTLSATEIVREALGVAADICIYTNRELTIETL